MLPYIITKQVNDNKIASPKEVLAIEYKKTPEVQEERPPSPSPPPPPEPVKVEAPAAQPPPDLLVIIAIYFGFLLLTYADCDLVWLLHLCLLRFLFVALAALLNFSPFGLLSRIWRTLIQLQQSWRRRMHWLWPSFLSVSYFSLSSI